MINKNEVKNVLDFLILHKEFDKNFVWKNFSGFLFAVLLTIQQIYNGLFFLLPLYFLFFFKSYFTYKIILKKEFFIVDFKYYKIEEIKLILNSFYKNKNYYINFNNIIFLLFLVNQFVIGNLFLFILLIIYSLLKLILYININFFLKKINSIINKN